MASLLNKSGWPTDDKWLTDYLKKYKLRMPVCMTVTELHRGGMDQAGIQCVLDIPSKAILGDRLSQLFIHCDRWDLYRRWLDGETLLMDSRNQVRSKIYCGNCGKPCIYLPCGYCRTSYQDRFVVPCSYLAKNPNSVSQKQSIWIGLHGHGAPHQRQRSDGYIYDRFHGKCLDDV